MKQIWARRRALEDDGYVLFAVIGVIALLTILSLGAYTLSSNNLAASKREGKSAQAVDIAEAGLDAAVYRLDKAPSSLSPLPYTFSVPTAGGAAAVTVTKSPGAGWLISSTASTGSPVVTRTVSGQVYAMALWDMFFADGSFEAVGSNGRLNGNGNLYGSFYCKGDWPFSNGNADFNIGPYYIKSGDVQLSGNAGFGKDGVPVAVYCDGNVSPTSFPGTWYPTCPDIKLPKLDLTAGYNRALAESIDTKQSNPNLSPASWVANSETTNGMVQAGSPGGYSTGGMNYYKVIDTDGNSTNKSKGTVTLSGDFGTLEDDFAIVGGVLYVHGTVYIDAAMLNINVAKFAGKGTIMCTGAVTVNGGSGGFTPVAPVGNYPAINNLAICAYGAITDMESPGYGPRYSATSWGQNPGGNYDSYYGAILAPTVGIGKHGSLYSTPNMSSYLPPSLPGAESTIISFTWRDGKQ